MQTTVAVQPVSIVFKCDGDVGKGSVWFAGDAGEIFTKTRSGILLQHHDMFLASFESPAFVPEKAMLLNLFSASPITVTEFETIPFTFP